MIVKKPKKKKKIENNLSRGYISILYRKNFGRKIISFLFDWCVKRKKNEFYREIFSSFKSFFQYSLMLRVLLRGGKH